MSGANNMGEPSGRKTVGADARTGSNVPEAEKETVHESDDYSREEE